MGLIDYTKLQMQLAKVPMEERTFRAAVNVALNMPLADAVYTKELRKIMTNSKLSDDEVWNKLRDLAGLKKNKGRPDRKKWIPVDKKLPQPYKEVLCWYEYYRYGDYNCMYQTYGIGIYDSKNNMWGGDITGHKARVIAWMPLPEKYKESN